MSQGRSSTTTVITIEQREEKEREGGLGERGACQFGGEGGGHPSQIAWNCETGAYGVHEAGGVAGTHMGP